MLMLYHGFYVLGLERIEARQLCYNKGSIKVHENVVKTEGILRKAVFKNGEYRDLNLMSVIGRILMLFDEISRLIIIVSKVLYLGVRIMNK